MTDELRWALNNTYTYAASAVQAALHSELKELYCSTRRLDADRMDCGGAPSLLPH